MPSNTQAKPSTGTPTLNALFISLDKNLLSEKQGDALKRHLRYSRYFNLLNIIVFTSKADGFIEPFCQEKLRIFPTNSSSRWNYVSDAISIASKIYENEGLDLVSTQDPFLTAIAGIIIKKITKASLNIQIHNDYASPHWRKESLQNLLFSILLPLVTRFADSVRSVSKAASVVVQKHPNVFVAPIAVNLEFFQPQSRRKTIDIISVGRLVPQKNFPLLINSVAQLTHKFPNLKVVIVGAGPQENKLQRLIEKDKLEKSISLVGAKDRNEVRALLCKSRIFVLPSNYEGWGLAAVEAAACGLPVVMTDTGGANEIVKEKKTGFIVPVNDKRLLIEKLSLLLKDEKKQKTMGKLARGRAEKLSLVQKKDKFIIDLIRSTQPG